jgi:hypothetical protein
LQENISAGPTSKPNCARPEGRTESARGETSTVNESRKAGNDVNALYDRGAVGIGRAGHAVRVE